MATSLELAAIDHRLGAFRYQFLQPLRVKLLRALDMAEAVVDRESADQQCAEQQDEVGEHGQDFTATYDRRKKRRWCFSGG